MHYVSQASLTNHMKHTLLALGAACTLSGCAGVGITHTDVATGATNPKAIYVRSYIAEDAKFKGRHGGGEGNRAIRRSLAPAEFSKALKEEMEKMAPARVLAHDEEPTTVPLPTAVAAAPPPPLATGRIRTVLLMAAVLCLLAALLLVWL